MPVRKVCSGTLQVSRPRACLPAVAATQWNLAIRSFSRTPSRWRSGEGETALVNHAAKKLKTFFGTVRHWLCFVVSSQSWQIAVINGTKYGLQPSLDVVPAAPLMNEDKLEASSATTNQLL